MAFWEYEPNKWLNTDYILHVEYDESPSKVEQTQLNDEIKGPRYKVVPRLKLTLLPGLPAGLPDRVEEPEKIRRALEMLGIQHPTLLPPDAGDQGPPRLP
jgi:hypothetical protein